MSFQNFIQQNDLPLQLCTRMSRLLAIRSTVNHVASTNARDYNGTKEMLCCVRLRHEVYAT